MSARSRRPTSVSVGDALDQDRDLLGGEGRGLALGDDELGAADGGGGVARDDLVHDEPVEEHLKRRERLLDDAVSSALRVSVST